MRKVKAWLVTRCADWGDVLVERPVTAFQRREMAERCMNVRAIRAMGAEGAVHVVSDDEREAGSGE